MAVAAGEETAHPEWFLAGTEPPVVAAPRSGAAWPRILAPPADAIIAIDPDIPAADQRVAFAAADATNAARWLLDGIDVGAAGDVTLWPPRAGAHTLVLVDEGRHALAQVRFVVRGPAGLSAVAR
jgi:penicillin-binding protein 1C